MARPSHEWKRVATTLFLRVPRGDWAAICAGSKTEFRASGKGARHGEHANLPKPVVAYSYLQYREEPQTALLVLEDSWVEPLGAISAESIAREGFASMSEFRTYWITRHTSHGGGTFKPLSRVQAYRVRPWTPEDRPAMADKLLVDLYGEFLP